MFSIAYDAEIAILDKSFKTIFKFKNEGNIARHADISEKWLIITCE